MSSSESDESYEDIKTSAGTRNTKKLKVEELVYSSHRNENTGKLIQVALKKSFA